MTHSVTRDPCVYCSVYMLVIGFAHLRQSHVRKVLKRQARIFAGAAQQLTQVHASSHHRRQRHAVAQEEDHILGALRVRLLLQVLPQRGLRSVAPKLGRVLSTQHRVAGGRCRRDGRRCSRRISDQQGIVRMLFGIHVSGRSRRRVCDCVVNARCSRSEKSSCLVCMRACNRIACDVLVNECCGKKTAVDTISLNTNHLHAVPGRLRVGRYTQRAPLRSSAPVRLCLRLRE